MAVCPVVVAVCEQTAAALLLPARSQAPHIHLYMILKLECVYSKLRGCKLAMLQLCGVRSSL
jgi:hypothetical protein